MIIAQLHVHTEQDLMSEGCLPRGETSASRHETITDACWIDFAMFIFSQVNSLSDVISWSPGVTKCPYNPRLNNTYVISTRGDLFSGTATDFTGRDAAIYRIGRTSKRLRTAQYNSRWLNGTSAILSLPFDIAQLRFHHCDWSLIN